MTDFTEMLIQELKNPEASPSFQELKIWIEEDLHKSLEDIRDISMHRDIIDIGVDMHDPDPQHHQYKNLAPGPAEITLYFNGDDMPYTRTIRQNTPLQKNVASTARDTQFAGFAAALGAKIADTDGWNLADVEKLIARSAYDLVQHALEYGNTHGIVFCPIEQIPDMPEVPEVE